MNLASILAAHPDGKSALIDGDRHLSYGQLRAAVGRVRGGLRERGVVSGDRVALLGENTIEIVVAYFAIVGLGAVAVPLNPLAPAAAVQHEVDTVRAKVVLSAMVNPPVAAIQISDIDGDDVPTVDVEIDHLAVLMFTSGTAGAPKAAMLSHGNLLANIEQSQNEPEAVRFDDVVLGLLPLHHIFGLNVALALSLTAGATVVLTSVFYPAATLGLIQNYGITVIPGVPTMWSAWSNLEWADSNAFATVRLALSGAAHLAEETATKLRDQVGVVVREGYGLTEASPIVTTSMGAAPRLGSIGKPMPGVRVRVVDEDGEDVLEGDTGEILVAGPNVFQGYWEDAEATARVLQDGWLRTGDVAVVDQDGYLYLVDRSKDLIIVSGFNVYPAEVEDVITGLAGVAEAAVVGVPHAPTGEAVKAYVVLAEGASITDAQVSAHCRAFLARYKCPTSVSFVDSLPKGLGGKVLRRLLR